MSGNKNLYPSRCAALPQVTPRLDPVVYSAWDVGAPLSKEKTQEFEEAGFIVLENVFSDDEVASFQDEAESLRTGGGDISKDTVFTELESGAVRSIFKIHEQNNLFAKLVRDPRLTPIAEYLLGEKVYIHQSRLNYKPGFEGKDFYWHSDFETWHVEDGMPRMRALSMSVLLTDNTPTNGPTMFMPGSHKLFVGCVGETPENHFQQSLRKQEYGVPDDDSLRRFAEAGIEMPTGPAGSVVIFDCNIMHGSNSNISPFPRSNAFFVYNAVSNKLVEPYGGMKPRPDFIAERNNFRSVSPLKDLLLQPAV